MKFDRFVNFFLFKFNLYITILIKYFFNVLFSLIPGWKIGNQADKNWWTFANKRLFHERRYMNF